MNKTAKKVAFSFVLCSALLYSSCADYLTEKSSSASTVSSEQQSGIDIQTSQAYISASASLEGMPITEDAQGKGASPTTRAFPMMGGDKDGHFYPQLSNGDKQIKARVFLVKYDKEHRGNNGPEFYMKTDSKLCLAAGEITFDKVANASGTGITLRTQNSNLTNLTWLNDKVDIKGGKEEWFICGVIGGRQDESLNPKNINKIIAGRHFDNEAAKQKYIRHIKNMYYFNIFFDPAAPNSQHNTYSSDGKLMADVPFSTGWIKLSNITGKNKVEIRNWHFKPLGVLLKFKIRRNEKLVKPEGHNYTFASSQISGNGFFTMCPLEDIADRTPQDETFGLDCRLRLNSNGSVHSINKQWYWNYEEDHRPWFNEPNPDHKKGGFYEWQYTYNSSKMRKPGVSNPKYDEFFVWGMPINDQYKGILRHQSMITAEHGGFMLGRKMTVKGKVRYADEWIVDTRSKEDKETSECIPNIQLEKGDGVGYKTIELGVVRPNFREVETTQDGKKLPKYPWPNPLERLARTNTILYADQPKFDDSFITGDNKWYARRRWNGYTEEKDKNGKKYNMTWKGKEFKKYFILDKNYVPSGYHVPNTEEWGVAFYNILENIPNRKINLNPWLFNGDKSLKDAPEPYFEIFSPRKDNMDETISINSSVGHKQSDYWKDLPVWASYFMKDDYKGEIYAIRFEPLFTEDDYLKIDEKDCKNSREIGRRYRCVYRYRFMNLGKQPENPYNSDGQGARIIIQSRWIGNADVNIKDIMSDEWWGDCSESNPLYNVDCYRVIAMYGNKANVEGAPTCNYYTRVQADYSAVQSGYDKYASDITFVSRKMSYKGFAIDYKPNNVYYYPVRLIASRETNEFSSQAPRNRPEFKKDGKDVELEFIRRPYDPKTKK